MHQAKLVSLKMGKNFGAKQFKGELKAAMQTAATEDGQIFLLLEDHNFTDPQFLDMVGTMQLLKPRDAKRERERERERESATINVQYRSKISGHNLVRPY